LTIASSGTLRLSAPAFLRFRERIDWLIRTQEVRTAFWPTSNAICVPAVPWKLARQKREVQRKGATFARMNAHCRISPSS
jgi:hypothetical protein